MLYKNDDPLYCPKMRKRSQMGKRRGVALPENAEKKSKG
ncbi:hypothetical protein G3A_16400 [Bacillus sp. 17376]|nr:hypothetical protein G3A_16400 [Bacillus sp. 17376]